jgi:hypothetical protein
MHYKLAEYEIKHLFRLIVELDDLEKHWYELSQATYGFSLHLDAVERQIQDKEQTILDTIRAFKYVNEYPEEVKNYNKVAQPEC